MLPSDDVLRTMIDQMPTLAWSCRPDGSAEFVNQRWLDYTGLSMEEAVGWGCDGHELPPRQVLQKRRFVAKSPLSFREPCDFCLRTGNRVKIHHCNHRCIPFLKSIGAKLPLIEQTNSEL